jgi:hypothetical protein
MARLTEFHRQHTIATEAYDLATEEFCARHVQETGRMKSRVVSVRWDQPPGGGVSDLWPCCGRKPSMLIIIIQNYIRAPH